MRFKRSLGLAVWLLAFALPALGQSDRGAVTGVAVSIVILKALDTAEVFPNASVALAVML